MERQPHLCKDCKFCLRLFDYEAESYSLFCGNLLTKEADAPIGFLDHNEQECEFFELVQAESRNHLSADKFNMTYVVARDYVNDRDE